MKYAVVVAMVMLFAPEVFAGDPAEASGQRWPAEKAWQWYKQQPWLCGFNYIPATAINYTEMWQKETFDPKTIDEELALAEQVRFNSLRCVLQYLVWEHDPDGFKQRMDEFLAICHKRGIRVVFCLFDDCVFGPKHDPYLGKQADVVPGWYAHDWSPSPGWSRVKAPKTWPKLRQYVQDVLTRFKDDPRVLIWDLYNEPTNGIGDATLPLLTKIVDWARQVNPSQPLSVGVWNENRKLNDLAVNRSDVITFHRYSNASQLEAIIHAMEKHGRPLVCTEWLKRDWGSVGDQLPVFVRHRVGCLHWGLVNGKTQTQYPWGSKAGAPEPKVWQHDLFRKDRTPYDPHEIELFTQAIAQGQRETSQNPKKKDGDEAAEPTANWPQWHGPTRDCRVGGPAWPKSLGEDHLKRLWRVDLGPGYPGPIVAADRVFVAETKDQKTEIVRALDRKTGRELWKAEWPGAMSVPFMAKRNGDWIRSTPAYDGQSLFVAGMRDVLVCLNAKTGEERWRIDFVQQFQAPLPNFGFVCSPLVVGDFVYVQAGAGFCKVNKQSGKVVWRVLTDGGGMFGSAFSSPVYRTLCGKPQLVVQTRMKLAGVEPESGKVLWSQDIPAMLGMNIVTPAVLGDRIYTSSYGGGSRLLEINRTGEDFQAQTVWKTPLQGYMSTPVIIGGLAYLHLRSQKVTCVELKTGKQTWTTTERYGEYWSLVAQKDHILALDQRGELFLIRATPEKFDLLDSRKISDEETWGHLAVCANQVFVRELKGISTYRWQ